MTRLFNRRWLLGLSLIAILSGVVLVPWLMSDDRPKRSEFIASLSFSSDNSRIAVAKLSWTYSGWKHYPADIARTISWLNVDDGRNHKILRQDSKLGEHGPAWHLLSAELTHALCNPSRDQLVTTWFESGQLAIRDGSREPIAVPAQHPAHTLSFSRSGRLLATRGGKDLTVFDLVKGSVSNRLTLTGDDVWNIFESLAFNHDENRVVLGSEVGILAWDFMKSREAVPLIERDKNSSRVKFAIAPDDTLIICSNPMVTRRDMAGSTIASLADEDGTPSISTNGEKLVVFNLMGYSVYDLATNSRILKASHEGLATAALSADGSVLAVGDVKGKVALMETKTGKRRWQSNPPGGDWPGGNK